MDFMPRRNGHAISGGRLKMPCMQSREYFLINAIPHTLYQPCFDYVTLGINGDDHHHFSLYSRRQVGFRDMRFGEGNGQRRANVIPTEAP